MLMTHLSIAVLIEVADGDVSALPRKCQGDSAPDARIAASDQRDLTAQTSCFVRCICSQSTYCRMLRLLRPCQPARCHRVLPLAWLRTMSVSLPDPR